MFVLTALFDYHSVERNTQLLPSQKWSNLPHDQRIKVQVMNIKTDGKRIYRSVNQLIRKLVKTHSYYSDLKYIIIYIYANCRF